MPPSRLPQDEEDAKKEWEKAIFKNPADIFKHFCKAESSEEDNQELEEGRTSKKTKKVPTPYSSSSLGKGVKWNPTLIEFSDGTKGSMATAAGDGGVGRKSESVTKLKGGKTQTKDDSKRKKESKSQKKPTKPPVVSGNPSFIPIVDGI